MGRSKNKKKQWRKCAEGIDEEIIKSNQLKEIDEASFDVTNKVKSTQLKYSTSPRVITKKIRGKVLNETIDLWSENFKTPVISKRRQSIIRNKSKYVKPEEMIHPGTSWFPEKKQHEELLDILATDQVQRTSEKEKYQFKPIEEKEVIEKNQDKAEEEESVEIELSMNDNVKKNKVLTAKQKKHKVIRMNRAEKIRQEHMKKKGEQHELNNIPKISLHLKRVKAEQKLKSEAVKELKIKKDADKVVKEQIHRMPFQLQSELAPCMRLLQPEGNLLQDLFDKVNGHKFRADKPRKMRKTKKMIKKKGLV